MLISLAASLIIAVVAAPPTPSYPRIVLGGIDAAAINASIESLVGFGTRHSMSDAASPTRGIGAARNWIKAHFDQIAQTDGCRDLKVSFESYTQPGSGPGSVPRITKDTEIVNVVAVLPGKMKEAADRRYYVVAHYDSRNGGEMDVSGDAPGANDDGSGTAAVLEIARVMCPMERPDATIVFLLTAGEEQGLLGAKYHAEHAAARNEKILGVLSNDIVGDPSSPEGVTPTPKAKSIVRVFSEGIPRNATAEQIARIRTLSAEADSPSRQLARYAFDIASMYNLPVKPMIVYRADRFLRGGDHLAFNEAGFPAIRFTELDEDYTRQHQNVTQKDGKPYGDVPAYVDEVYLADVARLNTAVLLSLANAPSSPPNARILTAELSNKTTLRWDRSPEPDTAGYEVVWRDTTSPTWQESRDVGNATEAVIELNKDDRIFGVRAYDRDGYRSPASFPSAAKE